MKKTVRMPIMGVLVIFLFCFCLVSGGDAKEKEVLIAGICGASGPVSEQVVPGVLGMEDGFAYFNKKGGLKGVKIKYVWHDNRYKVPEAVSIYKSFLAKKPIAISLWAGSGAHEAVMGFMNRDKIPGISMSMSDPQFFPPRYIFADTCGYGDQSAAFFDWFRSKWTQKRKIRIGYLTWNSPYGRAGYEEMKTYVATRGGEMVGIEYTTYAPTTVMPQLMRLSEKKVDYIWTNSYHPTVDVILKEMAQKGIKIVMAGNSNHPSDAQIMISGAERCEDYIGCSPFYSEDYEPKDKLPQDFLNLMKEAGTRRGGAKIHHQCYSRGWFHAFLYREAIRLALEKVDYEKLNGEALMKHGLLRIKDFKTPLTKMTAGLSSKDDRRFYPWVRFAAAKGGKTIAVSDWFKAPWLKKIVESK